MRILFPGIALLTCTMLFCVTSFAIAQVPNDTDQAEAAHLFAYYPKEGMEKEFDEGYARHLEWHRQNEDPLVWYGWYVVNGNRQGLFIDGSFGRPFSAFDQRVDLQGDIADAAENFSPFADPQFQSTYVLRRDLSTGQPLEEERPSAAVQVFHYQLRFGTEPQFERVLQVTREALLGMDEVPAHTWYKLVVGGELPGYMLMVAREGWSGYDRFRYRLTDLIVENREPAEAESLLNDLAASVDHVQSEMWLYRPDLSYFP